MIEISAESPRKTGRRALARALQKAAQKPALRRIVLFFEGPFWPAAYAFLTLICSLTGGEIPFYIFTGAALAFIALFSPDTKPALVPALLAVYSTSFMHSPRAEEDPSGYFGEPHVLAVLGAFAAVVLAAYAFRLVVFGAERNFFRSDGNFRWSALFLTVALLLNGAFFADYTVFDLLLGAAVALSLFGLYIFFFSTLRTRTGLTEYLAVNLVFACGVIFAQLLWALFVEGAYSGGTIDKDLVRVGWGMSNNIGGMLAMFCPACFYLAAVRRRGCIFYVLGFLFFGGVCLTQSRSSMLVGGAILLCILVYLSVKPSPHRLFFRIFNLAALFVALLASVLFRERIREIFAVLFERGFDDSDRFFIWKSGVKNFLRAPLFGVGFYEPIAPDWSYDIVNFVFPDMYHNLFVQMLASCGAAGAAALAFHLFELLRLCAGKKPATEKLFSLAVIAAILGTSLLDNHIVHIVPAMVYSVFLLSAEWSRAEEKRGADDPKEKKDLVPSPVPTEGKF